MERWIVVCSIRLRVLKTYGLARNDHCRCWTVRAICFVVWKQTWKKLHSELMLISSSGFDRHCDLETLVRLACNSLHTNVYHTLRNFFRIKKYVPQLADNICDFCRISESCLTWLLKFSKLAFWMVLDGKTPQESWCKDCSEEHIVDFCIDLAKDAWAVASVHQHFSSPMGARMPANTAAANVLTLLQIRVSASAKASWSQAVLLGL